MNVFKRFFPPAIAFALLMAGCSHPTPNGSSTSGTKPNGARLSEVEVIRLAGDAATKQGYQLGDYKTPEVHYEFTQKNQTWTVFYDGKVAMPGHHFLVDVNDRTGETRVAPGK